MIRKSTYLLFVISVFALPVFSQVRYDDGPIVTSGNFVTQGTWGRNNITFSFLNGTDDIPNSDEQNAIRQAFQIWADYANLNFTEVSSNGDIQLSWQVGDHGDGHPFDGINGVLAHTFFPPPDGGSLAGDVHFDDDENWTLVQQANGFQPIDLVTVAVHEIGHALGLGHSNVNCAVMNPIYTGSHRYLAQDDIDGIRSIYGNRSPIGTTNLGCSGGTFFIRDLPDGAFVTWNSSNTAVAPITINNNQCTTTWSGTSGALVRFTATITLPCGIVLTESINAAIGAPDYTTYTATFTSGGSAALSDCNDLVTQITPGYFNGYVSVSDVVAGSYNWTQFDKSSNASATMFFYPNGQNVEVRIKPQGGSGGWKLIRSNACGSSVTYHYFRANVICNEARMVTGPDANEKSLTVSPNPARDNITISLLNQQPATSGTEKITDVRIFDVLGRLRKYQRFNNSVNVTIDISDLLSGLYFVEVVYGKSVIRKNLNIQR